MKNKQRYIQEILDETIDLRKKSKTVILSMLSEKGYNIINDDSEYKYLLKMSMDSVSEENVDKITKSLDETQLKYNDLQSTTIEQLWLNDIDKFENEYKNYINERKKIYENELINTNNKKKIIKKKK